MGWIVFFICSIAVFILTKPYRKWEQLWYAGMITMAALYVVDPIFIALGAFSYQYPNPSLGGMPTFYYLSSFFGGIVLVRYYPQKTVWKLPYILLSSFIFLLLEIVMYFFGYFNYHNWSPINSFSLNVFGITVVIWLWNWVCEIRNKKTI